LHVEIALRLEVSWKAEINRLSSYACFHLLVRTAV